MNTRKRDQPLASHLTLTAPEWLTAESVEPSSIETSVIDLPQSQPRRYFDVSGIAALTESIRADGVLQPILVRPRRLGGYELVAGERRLRAATAAGLTQIPAIVRDLDDIAARRIALLENLQREDLNPFEETIAIVDLLALQLKRSADSIPTLLRQLFNTVHRPMRPGKQVESDSDNNVIISADSPDDPDALKHTIEQFFQPLSMSWESFVTNRLPLLKLPADIQQALRQGEIAYTKAKLIAAVKDEEARSQLLAEAIAHDWSLNDIKTRIAAIKTKENLPIQKEIDTAYRKIKKARIWEDPQKQVRLQALLKELNSLLDE